jgi:hypothetical protein
LILKAEDPEHMATFDAAVAVLRERAALPGPVFSRAGARGVASPSPPAALALIPVLTGLVEAMFANRVGPRDAIIQALVRAWKTLFASVRGFWVATNQLA